LSRTLPHELPTGSLPNPSAPQELYISDQMDPSLPSLGPWNTTVLPFLSPPGFHVTSLPGHLGQPFLPTLFGPHHCLPDPYCPCAGQPGTALRCCGTWDHMCLWVPEPHSYRPACVSVCVDTSCATWGEGHGAGGGSSLDFSGIKFHFIFLHLCQVRYVLSSWMPPVSFPGSCFLKLWVLF
jgi:hypothetical protein